MLVRITGFIALILYTLALLILEMQTSQDYVRNYFAEITGPVRFYAVNTSATVFLLWGTALLFAVSLLMFVNSRRDSLFFLSQIGLFAYLGLDDRFLLHEWLVPRLGLTDAVVFLGLGLIEIGLLFGPGALRQRSRPGQRYVFLAGLCFALMVGVDNFLPPDMLLRLSVEDLAKLWAATFLFLFGWEICHEKVKALSTA